MKYVVILRGINVSGKNVIRMADLKAALVVNGFSEIETYIQSGNISIVQNKYEQATLEKEIEKIIETHFGLIVPVIALDKINLQKVIANNPYIHSDQIGDRAFYVTFLKELSNEKLSTSLAAECYLPDEFIISGKTVYLKIQTSYGTTKLNTNFFERKLKVIATTRNWKTLMKLLEMVQ